MPLQPQTYQQVHLAAVVVAVVLGYVADMAVWQGLQLLDQERPWLLDTALALGLLAASLSAEASNRPPPLQILLMVIVAAAYAARRTAPLPVLLLTGILVVVMVWLGFGTAVIGAGLFLGAYTVAAHSGIRATAAAAVFVVALVTLLAVVVPGRMTAGEAATNLALFAGAIVLGRAARLHREAARLVLEQAALTERVQQEQARAALTEERLRIARELHDVVGHSLGVIALQAGVGARVVESDPAEARAALLAIAERSRESLHEVRQILSGVRDPESTSTPTPGLDALPALLDRLSEAGLDVDLAVTGQVWLLPQPEEHTAFRVLQESLTNVVRHAGTDGATVRLTWGEDALELRVLDHGRGPAGNTSRGAGLRGMAERVAMCGGTLTAGRAPGGGFEVSVRIPRKPLP